LHIGGINPTTRLTPFLYTNLDTTTTVILSMEKSVEMRWCWLITGKLSIQKKFWIWLTYSFFFTIDQE